MFKKVVLICTLLLLYSVPIMAESETNVKVVLDQDLLMSLTPTTRESVMSAIQDKAEAAAKLADVATVEKTMSMIAGVNIDEFQGKAVAIADAINSFCEKLGVTVNDFISTPAGNFIIFGALWKLGIFGSIWGFFKGFGCVFVLLWLLYSVNTRKKYTLYSKDADGKIIRSEEFIVPKLSAIFSGSKNEETVYAVVSSIILMILLFLTVCFVI